MTKSVAKTLPRYVIVGLLAVIIVLALYLIMQYMVGQDANTGKGQEDSAAIDFYKVKPETEVKKNPPPKPPEPTPAEKPPQRPTLDIEQEQNPEDATPPDVDVPNIDTSPNGTEPFSPSNGNMNQEGGVIPIVKIAPQYPRKPLMAKIEGWVKVKFTITTAGTVSNAQVIEAKPKRIFDQAALKAIRKFKFKPKVVNGQRVEQIATQTIEFELPDD